jgi:hypothetical protein
VNFYEVPPGKMQLLLHVQNLQNPMKKLFLAATLLALSARANVSISAVRFPSATSKGVPYFFGEITPESVDAFISKYDKRNDITELRINSQGGDVKAGIKFGKWVQKKGLNVTVPIFCFSACANYVFIAGKNKVLKPGSFIGWHGDAEQKDFRELVGEYEKILRKREKSTLTNNEKIFLKTNRKKYKSIKELRQLQGDFYASLNVNPEFGIIGQEPVYYPSDGWTLTKRAMVHFRILNVEVPNGYGDVGYFAAAPLSTMINKGPLLILDVDNSGNIFPVNLDQITKVN